MQCVDEVGVEELPDGGDASADTHVPAVGGLEGTRQGVLRAGVEEVERGGRSGCPINASRLAKRVDAGLLTRDDAPSHRQKVATFNV